MAGFPRYFENEGEMYLFLAKHLLMSFTIVIVIPGLEVLANTGWF